jgi:hypothetical protein
MPTGPAPAAADGTAARQHHGELQPADLHGLAAPRHVAQLVRDDAADGVERVFRQRHVERVVDLGDAGVAGHAHAAVGQRVDAALGIGVVEFVLDLADDLLEHVLDREQPGGVAELVDHDRQVVAVAAELAQQLVEVLRFGHEHRGPQQRAQVQLRGALQLEEILGHQRAQDVLALAFVDGEARVAGADHGGQQLVVGGVDGQQVHARGGDHHVAGRHVRHAQHALEHRA